MAKPRVSAAGGVFTLYKRMRSRNACKTRAYGMGGQRGGMVNEAGSFPEVCKKSLRVQAGDTDIHLQPHVGADIACCEALLQGIVEADARANPWEALLAASGLQRVDVDRAVTVNLFAYLTN